MMTPEKLDEARRVAQFIEGAEPCCDKHPERYYVRVAGCLSGSMSPKDAVALAMLPGELLRDRDELAALVREADEFAQGIEESFDGHYGDEGVSADCTEACGEGWNEPGTTCDSDKHRPDIEHDRCDRQDECFRCMALDVREKFAAVLAKAEAVK